MTEVSAPLPPYTTVAEVAERLPLVFPEGTPNRNYCTRTTAAHTVFVMLYIGAVEGMGRYLAPIHVYRMNDTQAHVSDGAARLEYARVLTSRKRDDRELAAHYRSAPDRWYNDNTREPIRDETLREGLVALGTVTIDATVPVTSGRPRYALQSAFAALFDPALDPPALRAAITAYQAAHLSPSARARINVVRAGAAQSGDGVKVTYPNGETRRLSPGPSSIITKAVVEVFAKRFLKTPAVLWLSESGKKVVKRDDELAKKIGLAIAADRELPDLILVDVGQSPLIVFVEVVATDGPINARRQDALFQITDRAAIPRDDIAFVTAYLDRESAAFRKTVSTLAWGSFAWFASEPDGVVALHDGVRRLGPLSDILTR